MPNTLKGIFDKEYSTDEGENIDFPLCKGGLRGIFAVLCKISPNPSLLKRGDGEHKKQRMKMNFFLGYWIFKKLLNSPAENMCRKTRKNLKGGYYD